MSIKLKIISICIAVILFATALVTGLCYAFNPSFKEKFDDVFSIKNKADQSIDVEVDNSSNIDSGESVNSSVYSVSNILYNGNFLINERGSSTYTRSAEDIYTADRWGLFYGDGSFNVSTHELTGLDETQPVVFAQWVEDTKTLLYGETITVSATINDVRHSATFEVPTTYSEDFIYNIFEGEGFCFRVLVRSNNLMSVQFLAENGVTIKIDKVKLELSEIETRYVERPRAEELLMCQRYFQKLSVNTMGYAFNETTLFFLVNLTTTMRSYKSVVIKTNPNVVVNGEKVACEEISLRQVIDNGILFKYTGSGYTKNSPYMFILGVIHVDGDIYL